MYNANTLDRAWAQMKTLGRITGHEVQAQNLVRKNLDNLAHVKAKLARAKVKHKRVMRLMGRDKIMTPGTDTFQAEMIRAAGGQAPDFGKPARLCPLPWKSGPVLIPGDLRLWG